MTNFSNNSRANPLAVLALTVASFLPLSARAQEGTPQGEKNPAAPTSPFNDVFKDSILTLPTNGAKVDLPQRVLDKAAEKAINPAMIKLEQGKWVECTEKGCTIILPATTEEIQKYTAIKGLRTGDVLSITGHTYATHRVEAEKNYGIPGLGTFTTETDGTKTFTPDAKFKGTVSRGENTADIDKTKSPDKSKTLKSGGAEFTEVSYSKENLQKIHERFMLELDTTFVFVISVPSQCPPCRAYEPVLKKAAAQYPADSKVVFLISNYDSFAEATRVTGATRFPTTVVLPRLKNDRFTYEVDPNWETKPFLKAIKRPGYLEEGIKQPGPLREIVSKTLQVPKDALRGITRSLTELLGVGN